MKIAKNLLFVSVTMSLIWAPMARVAFAQDAQVAAQQTTAPPVAPTAGEEPAKEASPAGKRKSKQETMKAERKEWKKRLKATDPMAFKKLVETRDELQKEVVEKTDQLIMAETKIKNLSTENQNLKAGAEFAGVLAANGEDAGRGGAAGRSHPKVAGVVFKVQIGAFRNKDLTKYLENNPNFSGDVDSDGQKKYTLGQFKDYWQADQFKKYLREMGVNDAWVVSYKDGERVPIKDVLEGAVAMK